MMTESFSPVRIELEAEFLVSSYRTALADLYNENFLLKAYISKLKEENDKYKDLIGDSSGFLKKNEVITRD